ncbi:MAG: ABC transporter ATP-binding protein [Oscillospiraceae bacterium]
MAEVVLKNVKKIYPNAETEKKKSKKKKGEEPVEEKKVNLQITDKGVVAVQEFNINIADKEFIVLVGPSGCGKSTTLRMIAGLEEISEGELYIDGKLMNDMAPKDRDIAMVFQNYALYPHMTVYENMAFSLRLKKVPHTDENGKTVYKKIPEEEIDRKVREAAEILDITQYLDRKPKALSGGQRQRVAIGRAIVRKPKVFLMDEPLSNLDAKLRNQMRAEIIKLREKIDTTFIYVTHDQVEAMTLGDRIVIMRDGFIQQIGTPQEVFNHPANLFVAGFIGTPQMNFFRDSRLLKKDDKYYVTVMGREYELDEKQQAALREKNMPEKDVIVGIRPVHVNIAAEGIGANIDVSEMMGSELHLHLSAGEQDIVAVVPTTHIEINAMGHHQAVKFDFAPSLIHIFDKETEVNLL